MLRRGGTVDDNPVPVAAYLATAYAARSAYLAKGKGADRRILIRVAPTSYAEPKGRIPEGTAIIDSGATHSFVTSAHLKRFFPHLAITPLDNPTSVGVANGESSPILGTVSLQLDTHVGTLRTGHHVAIPKPIRFTLDAYVVDQGLDEMLVGMYDLVAAEDGTGGGARELGALLAEYMAGKVQVLPLAPPRARFIDIGGPHAYGEMYAATYHEVHHLNRADTEAPDPTTASPGPIPTREELEKALQTRDFGSGAWVYTIDGFYYRRSTFGDLTTQSKSGAKGFGPVSVSPAMAHVTPLKHGLTRRFQPKYRDALADLFDTMLKEGTLVDLGDPRDPSNAGAHIHPLVIAIKSDGTLRPCLDLVAFNELVNEVAPTTTSLDSVRTALAHLQGADAMWTLDLRKAFFQIPMAEESQKYFTCVGPSGKLYAYRSLVMGYTQSSGILADGLQRMLANVPGTYCYADNVYGRVTRLPGESDHDLGVRCADQLFKVLDLFAQHDVKVGIKDVQLGKSINLLGYIVDGKTLRFSEEAFQGVRDLPIPFKATPSKDQLSRTIGVLSYVRDGVVLTVPDAHRYAELASHANKFVHEPGRAATYDKTLDDALLAMQSLVLNATPAVLPDHKAKWRVRSDASKRGYCWDAAFYDEEAHAWRIVYMQARQFSDAQQRWPVAVRELYGVVNAVRKLYRHLLRNVDWTLQVDHFNLLLARSKGSNSIQWPWWAEIAHARPTRIEHVEGKSFEADIASRLDTYPVEAEPPGPDIFDYELSMASAVIAAHTAATRRTLVQQQAVDRSTRNALRALNGGEPVPVPTKRASRALRELGDFNGRPASYDVVQPDGPAPSPPPSPPATPPAVRSPTPPATPVRRTPVRPPTPPASAKRTRTRLAPVGSPLSPSPLPQSPERPPHPATTVRAEEPFTVPTGMDIHAKVLRTAAAANNTPTNVDIFVNAGASPKHLPTGMVYVIDGGVCINDNDLINELIDYTHDATVHGSARNTLARLSSVWFPNKASRVEKWVKSCKTCQMEPARIARKTPPHGPLNLRPRPEHCWEVVHIDHIPIGNDPTGKCAILHIQDAASRWSSFVPTFTMTAQETVDILTEHVGVWGPIKHIIHDGAQCFEGDVFDTWANLNHTTHKPTHAYTARANGLVERVHGPLRRALGLLSGHDRAHWVHVLRRAQWLINTNPHRILGCSPFEYMFARPPPQLLAVMPDIVERSLAMDCAEALRSVANWHSLWGACLSKADYDSAATAPTYKSGDFVIVRIPQDGKQQPAWTGPFRVHDMEPDREGYVLIEQERDGKGYNIASVAVDHLRLYDNTRPGQTYVPPLRHGTHLPVAVLGERGSGHTLQLQVKWSDGDITYESVAGANKNHSVSRHAIVRAYMGKRARV